MATIGGISYMLTAKTSEFVRKMRKAGRAVSDFASKMANGVGRLAKWGAAVAAAGIAIGGYFVKQQMKAIDEISKLSDELGISTEALAGFQHSASLTGTSAETVNKGLQRMVRMMGDAKNGISTAVRGFDQMGITMDQVRKSSPEQMLMRISDRLKDIHNPAERAAAIYGIFGRQGQEMANFLMQGSEAMKASRVEAELLGLTFDRKLGAKVEMANDAMDRMGKAVTGIFRQLAGAVAPYLQVIADGLVGWITAGDGVPGMMKGVINALRSGVGVALDIIQSFVLRIRLAVAKVNQWAKDAAFSYLALVGSEAEALAAAQAETEAEYETLAAAKALRQFQEGSKSWAKDLEGLMANIEDKAQKVADQQERISKEAQLSNYFKSALQPAKDILSTVQAIGGAVRKFGAMELSTKAAEATKSMWDGLVSATNKMGAQTAAMLRASMPDRVLATDAIGSFSARQIGSMQSSRDREVAMRLDEERNEHLREIANYLEKGIPAP